jgi:hypothetical protein
MNVFALNVLALKDETVVRCGTGKLHHPFANCAKSLAYLHKGLQLNGLRLE